MTCDRRVSLVGRKECRRAAGSNIDFKNLCEGCRLRSAAGYRAFVYIEIKAYSTLLYFFTVIPALVVRWVVQESLEIAKI